MSLRHWMGVALVALALVAASRANAAGGEFSYAAFDTVLIRHLASERVDYGALARDRAPLERFLSSTRDARPAAWARNDQIAFWVNVYNARVLDGVVRRPGLKSVLDVGKVVGVPTLGFFREKFFVAGRELALNDIEHEILRKGFHEPRVHFVLNCASASCPSLPARALSGATLDSTLDAAASAFLADRSKNPVVSGSDLRLSSIFKWYRSDFESAAGSLAAFLQRHANRGDAVLDGALIHFADYDWSLNGHW